MPDSELMADATYSKTHQKLADEYAQYQQDGQMSSLKEASDTAKKLHLLKQILCSVKTAEPKINTKGKIPDSHIVFLDELFKANDGILNSLLTALNERVYTNEGQTVEIPVISFFSASNEIPNFKDSAQAILKPLYDRFDLKVLTSYVQDRDNRMAVLRSKQNPNGTKINETITLAELEQMQAEVRAVRISDKINELMDNVLCTLRVNGIHVSDRKYFSFTDIVKAKAYLSGNLEVTTKDLLVLKNYFWNTLEEITKVENILVNLCENPVGSEVDKLLEAANEAYVQMEEALSNGEDSMKPYVKFSKELLRLYTELTDLEVPEMSDSETDEIERGKLTLEELSQEADNAVNTTHITMAERKRLNV